jgi:demethylmenaquinone methyltransferase / 2-methoxy-6-polyprenyl-1,4-benzoquinol methylase
MAKGYFSSVRPNTLSPKSDAAEPMGSVHSIFNRISDRYDFLNHFLSGGLDIGWRKKMVNKMRFSKAHSYLDIATGTGDVAISCAKHHPEVRVVGADFAESMLMRAKVKVDAAGLTRRIHLQYADATHLPFGDNIFDAVGIAFGIRNIPEKRKALFEMVRVITSGGQVLILELTPPENRRLRPVYNFYLRNVLPFLAGIFSARKEAYKYLAESIIEFPRRKEFLAIMSESGIQNPVAIPLSLGICHLYLGDKRKCP